MKISRKMAVIPADLKATLKWYFKLTQPLHGIKNQGIEVLTALLYAYHNTNNKLDEIDRWAEVFNYDTKIKIKDSLKNMNDATFNNHLSILRRKGAIINNRISPSFNPAINKETDAFEVILRFVIKK
jgi:hypothetical protein